VTLIIGPDQLAALAGLRQRAGANPIDVTKLAALVATSEGKSAHMDRVGRLTIELPLNYLVSLTIETGHPVGPCRHLSVSSQIAGRVPLPETVWMIAQELGFAGSLRDCTAWVEDLIRNDLIAKTINVVQPIAANNATERQQ
jgi:hypothetical protein